MRRTRNAGMKWAAFVSLTAVFAALGTDLGTATPEILIDGSFEDWKSRPVQGFTKKPTGQPMGILGGWVCESDGTLHGRMSAEEPIQIQTSFYEMLIDADCSPMTGFKVSGIGAEYLIENGSVHEYTGVDGQTWSWRRLGEAPYSIGDSDGRTGNCMEFSVPLDGLKLDRLRFKVVFHNFRNQEGRMAAMAAPDGGLEFRRSSKTSAQVPLGGTERKP